MTAALSLLTLAGCNQSEEPRPEAGNRTLMLTARMPQEPENRLALTADGKNLKLTWDKTSDKLLLNFKYNGTYYRSGECPITRVSADGKVATFAVTIPAEIPADATFDLYGVHQKLCNWSSNDGGFFQRITPTNNEYLIEGSEEACITLDKMGTNEKGIIRPMIYCAKTGVTAATLGTLQFQHTGWVVALHFKNNTGAEMEMPCYINLKSRLSDAIFYNGFHSTEDVYFNPETKVFHSSGTWKTSIHFEINSSGYTWLPYYGQKIGAGEEKIFYRWVVSSTLDIPALEGEVYITSNNTTATKTPVRTVQVGKIYHIYTKWDGTKFEFGK